MKKALALILTATMLLSCLVIGASAERVWSVEEKVVREDTATYLGGGSFAGHYYNDPMSDGNYTFTIVIMGDANTETEGKGFESSAFCDGSPLLNQPAGTVGFQGAPSSVSYTFEDGVWYTIEYVVSEDDETTTIKVNGETAGTIDAYMTPNFYGSWYRGYVGEVWYEFENGFRWGDDFEDGTDDIYAGTIETIKEVEKIYTNENVEMATSTATYLGGGSFAGHYYNNPMSDGNYTFTIVIMGDANKEDEGKGFESSAFCDGSPLLNQPAGTVGFQGAPSSVSYTFEDGVWYTIEYVVSEDDDTTTIKVNGETAGTIDAYMTPNFYGSWYRGYVDSVWYEFENGHTWGDDFEDGTDDIYAGTITDVAKAGAAHDLGMKYWNCNFYFDPDFNCTGDEVFEMDVMFDPELADGSAFTNIFISGPKFDLDAGTIGVNNATVDCNLKANVWYHTKFVGDGSQTAIYVDGTLVGTVNAVLGDLCFNGMGMNIDNLKVGDHFEDFEDGEWDEKGGSSGTVIDYDFSEAPEIDPYTVLDNGAAEGDAVMFKTNKRDGGTSYFYNPGDYPDVKSSKTVYAFDLALVANDANGFDEPGKTWFGIWRDTGSKRFKVGYDVNNTQLTGFAGEGDAVVGFDWGEQSATNFHDVIMVFKGTKAAIYVDGVLLYEGASGTPGINGSGATLFEVANGTAIIDNFKVYSPDECELLYDGFGTLESNGNFSQAYDWTIGADCSENPCIYGKTVRTTEPTCYSTGVDTKYCALCGEEMGTDSVGMIAHRYAKFDMKRTENDLFYTYCQNSGCTEKFYVTPSEYDYEGTMHAYFDMSDAFLAKLADGSDGEPYYGDALTYENGVAVADERAYPGNYTKWSMSETISDRIEGKDQSIGFDFTYLGTWDTDDNINSNYPHQLVFFLCGDNAAWLDFNFDENAVKIYGNQFAGYKIPEVTVPYAFVEGAKYDIQITYHQYDTIIEGSDWVDDDGNTQYEYDLACDLYVKINGETVIAYDYYNYADLNHTIAYADGASQLSAYYIRNFGVKYAIDNIVIGTSDFQWTGRTYVGDVDGNNYLEANDALCMRKFLAKVIDDADLCVSRMDANDDGEINAKDQLTIRKALAA